MPSILHSVGNKIRIENTGCNPVSLRKHEHFCQVRPVYVPSTDPEPGTSPNGTKNTSGTHVKPSILYSSQVTIDPDGILTRETVQAMKDSLARNDTVFSPISRGYNGQAGPFQARVNIGPVMCPQRKGRLPQYSRGQLELLQAQFNESMGVFQKPEDIGITVEYLNPSFSLRKAPVDSAL